MVTAAPTGVSVHAKTRILVVDDEPGVRAFVVRALSDTGCAIDIADDGHSAVAMVAREHYALVILDLVLPDIDGRAVLSQIRRIHPGQQVIVLSCLGEIDAKVECLELGAQDYLTKPFVLAELSARVRARLREATRHDELVERGQLVLDTGRLVADSGHGPVPLTRLEFLLLRELMEHDGHLVTKGELLASVWGLDFEPGSNVVDVCVRRLRSKLGFSLIKTVRGEGYQLAS